MPPAAITVCECALLPPAHREHNARSAELHVRGTKREKEKEPFEKSIKE